MIPAFQEDNARGCQNEFLHFSSLKRDLRTPGINTGRGKGAWSSYFTLLHQREYL